MTVVITSMPAPSSSSTSCHRFSWREPGTLVCASSSTSATCGLPGEHRVDVHLLEAAHRGTSASGAGTTSRPSTMARGVPSPVRLDEADDHVGAALRTVDGPRRAWRRSSRRPGQRRGRREAVRVPCEPPVFSVRSSGREGPVQGEVQQQDVDPVLTEEPEGPVARCSCRSRSVVRRPPGRRAPRHPRDLQVGVGRADVRVEPGAAGQERVGRHLTRLAVVERGDGLASLARRA